jgi:transcription elongation factor
MARIMEELCEAASFQPGDRVKTLRGSMRGTIVRLLPDGRVVWRADSGTELTALPESLLRNQAPRR